MTESVFKHFTSDEMSNDFYHDPDAWTAEYVSGSSLSEIKSSCLAAWKFNQKTTSNALMFGTQSHTNFESKALFESQYRRAPDADEIREELQNLRAKNPDDITLELITSQAALAAKLKAMGLTGTSNKQYPDLIKMMADADVNLHVMHVIDLVAQSKAWRDGVELVAAKDYDACVNMRAVLELIPEHAACMNSETAFREMSIFGVISGVKVKVRLDHVDIVNDPEYIAKLGYNPEEHPEVVVITDYKTTQSANPAEFPRLAFNLGYYLKMALQRDLFVKTFEEKRPVVIRLLAQEKKEPFLPMAFRLSREQLLIGRSQYMSVLNDFAISQERDVWPSYCNGEPEIELDTPAWVKAEYKHLFEQQ